MSRGGLTRAAVWRSGLIGFVVLALAMVPAAWVAGRVDRVPIPPTPGSRGGEQSARQGLGWAGGRWNKLALLAGIYFLRSLTLAWYLMSAPTPASTLVFAAIVGFLWLGGGPLVAGWIAELFGLRWQATASRSSAPQVGSFVGAFGGGPLFGAFGSYTLAWQGGVAHAVQALPVEGRAHRRLPGAARGVGAARRA